MTTAVTELSLSKLNPAPDNLRRKVNTAGDEWKRFVDSIKSQGVIVPLLVSPDGADTYLVVAGHRRLEGARAAGLERTPCVVREMSDEERWQAMLVENLQRLDLDPVEEASGFFRLAETGMTQADLARRVGVSKTYVSERLRLLELPPKALAAVKTGKVDLKGALALTKVKADPELIEQIIESSRRIDDYTVENAVARRERELAREEATKALTEGGATVVEHPGYNWRGTGYTPLRDLDLDLSKARLNALIKEGPEWLAAAVDTGGAIDWVTSDPKATRRHFGVTGPVLGDAEREQRDAERTARREERERDARRGDAVTRVVQGRLPGATEVAEIAADALVDACDAETCKRAAKLLGLEPRPPREGGQVAAWDYKHAIAGFTGDPRRLVMALGMAQGERRAVQSYGPPSAIAYRFAERLDVAGYAVDDDPSLKAVR